MEASQAAAPPPLLPPSSIPEIPTARIERYKIAWRVFMIANLGLGGYESDVVSREHEWDVVLSDKATFCSRESFARGQGLCSSVHKHVQKTIAYIFARAKMKASSLKVEQAPLKSPLPASAPPPTVESLEETEIAPSTAIADLVKVREPVPEEYQRELFKWMLDEKRKIKPRNKDDKRLIDEEKAILKKFIRAETVPSL
ncbi:hypothetical protein KSS87_012042 [Heliosperma pusillum]|nr:hypothetical protein KSS87_012042 [Heliosperma pusillum]